MSVKFWEGKADAVAQVGDFQITGYDPATTYKITIGDIVISTLGTGGSIATTITALLALLQADTLHPYFDNITWSSPAADKIRGTANTAGVPFVATFTKSGGAGTVAAYAVVTASAGPNDWSTATNWSDNVVPVNGDTVILKDSDVDILWGLDQSTIHLAKLQQFQSFTGKFGLDYTVLTTSSSSSADVLEYRTVYPSFDYITIVESGEIVGPGTPTGCPRFLLNLVSAATQSVVTIFNSASSSADANRPVLRFKSAMSTNDFYIRSAPGGVGFADEVPGETSTLRKISISDQGSSTTVQIGAGCTYSEFNQTGGTNTLRAAADVTTVRCMGGTLTTEGDYTITNLIADGGIIYCNHIKTGGNAVTKGFAKTNGFIDGTKSNFVRTWNQLYIQPPTGKALWNGLFVTVTTLGTGDCNAAQYQGKVLVSVSNG